VVGIGGSVVVVEVVVLVVVEVVDVVAMIVGRGPSGEMEPLTATMVVGGAVVSRSRALMAWMARGPVTEAVTAVDVTTAMITRNEASLATTEAINLASGVRSTGAFRSGDESSIGRHMPPPHEENYPGLPEIVSLRRALILARGR